MYFFHWLLSLLIKVSEKCWSSKFQGCNLLGDLQVLKRRQCQKREVVQKGKDQTPLSTMCYFFTVDIKQLRHSPMFSESSLFCQTPFSMKNLKPVPNFATFWRPHPSKLVDWWEEGFHNIQNLFTVLVQILSKVYIFLPPI